MIFGLLLAGFTVLTILTGNHFWHEYQQTLSSCRQNPATPSCSDIEGSFGPSYGAILRLVYVTSIGVPLIFGLFLGAPLFSREFEEGTNKLVWTQSVSRRKWLTTKIVWILVFAALYGLAISLLVSWWGRTTNALDHSRFDTGQFDVQGIMPFAYSVFFTAIGFTVSAWFRKTMVALAVTLVLFIAFQASIGQWLRPHYMAAISITSPMGPDDLQSKVPVGAWLLDRGILNKNGKEIGDIFPAAPLQCQQIIQQQTPQGNGLAIRVKTFPGAGDPIDACLNKAGFHQIAKYQPSYRYWDFQRIEAGIYFGASIILISAAYWFVLKRDA